MASQINDEYGERGLVYMQIIHGGTYGDYRDAKRWAEEMDHNGDGQIEKLNILVIADTDTGLYNRYSDNCAGLSGINLLLCQSSCPVTPVTHIVDQGGVTVDDCTRGAGAQCGGACGLDTAGLRSVLDSILPPKWCGEATP